MNKRKELKPLLDDMNELHDLTFIYDRDDDIKIIDNRWCVCHWNGKLYIQGEGNEPRSLNLLKTKMGRRIIINIWRKHFEEF